MAFPVTFSGTPLVFDTLPALKVRFWHTPNGGRKLYSMARFYLLDGALHLRLTAFERTPPPGSRISFAVGGNAGQYALVTLAPGWARLRYMPVAGAAPLPADDDAGFEALPPPERVGGVDEQGWYWGGVLQLGGAVLARCGCGSAPGGRLVAAAFKHSVESNAFGASFSYTDPHAPLEFTCFEPFEVVDY